MYKAFPIASEEAQTPAQLGSQTGSTALLSSALARSEPFCPNETVQCHCIVKVYTFIDHRPFIVAEVECWMLG